METNRFLVFVLWLQRPPALMVCDALGLTGQQQDQSKEYCAAACRQARPLHPKNKTERQCNRSSSCACDSAAARCQAAGAAR